jgi:hypothetical protein
MSTEEVIFASSARLKAAKIDLSPYVTSLIVLMPAITSFQRAEWTERGWRSASGKAKFPLPKTMVKRYYRAAYRVVYIS